MVGTSPGFAQNSGGIGWLPWGKDAFALAQQQDKPVLLYISAVWCYWCHVMENTTLADGEVATYVSQNFIPILVDNDHRPDVNARYNVGGWPTTAFLTSQGGYIAGATYLPADQMLAMLMEVKRAYDEDKPGIFDQAAQLYRQRQEFLGRVSPGGEVGHYLVDIISRRMAGVYDARNGGFGDEPKFPSAPILKLFLHLYRTTGEEFYRAILTKTLDAMVGGEYFDSVDGGFFRYSAQADWTNPQYEKMLEDNINLAGVFLDAGILLSEPNYTQVGRQTLQYLTNTLLDDRAAGFRGSQGAHSDYFGLSEHDRQESSAPPPDPYSYTHWTCQAVSLMLEASWKLPDPMLAEMALEFVGCVGSRIFGEHLPHTYGGPAQAPQQPTATVDLLCDWAWYLNALMDAHNCSPFSTGEYLQQAIRVADLLDERFHDRSSGAYCDVVADPDAVGYMRLREKPLPENVAVVQALLKLHHATGEVRYQLSAERVLCAYVEANRDFGEHGAAYALAVEMFLSPPVEITIEGSLGNAGAHALSLAAARVRHPHVIVKPPATRGFGESAAHVCIDTLCFPPVTHPEELAKSVDEALSGQQLSTGIFENFVNF